MMSYHERNLCRCIAELMNGHEPEWNKAGITREMRNEIYRLAEMQRAKELDNASGQ